MNVCALAALRRHGKSIIAPAVGLWEVDGEEVGGRGYGGHNAAVRDSDTRTRKES